MTCARVRRLLAAYRRDEWSPAELEALGRHLAACAECRRVEATFREVGENVRQLPSITPPPSLRANVFAAIGKIAAEEALMPRTAVAMTRDDTQPRLTAVRRTAPDEPLRRPFVVGTPAAIAVAALLLVGLLLARFLPSMAPGLPSLAASLSGGAPASLSNAASLHITEYAALASAGHVKGALASSNWVVYVATSADGNSMLYAVSRSNRQTVSLLSSPFSGRIFLRGLSDEWVLWQAGDNSATSSWTLAASRLPAVGSTSVLSPLVLATNGDMAAATPALVTGVWVAHDTVLAALSMHGDGAEIVRFDLFADQEAPLTHLIAQTQIPGHALTDPSLVGNTTYWAEVWLDSANGLHSDVWRGGGTGSARKVTQTGLAFAPRTTAQVLIWVQPSGPVGLDAAILAVQPAQAIENSLDQLVGSIQMQELAGGDGGRDLSANGAASSLAVSGSVLVWRDGGLSHTFDLSRNGPSTIDRQIREAAYVGATGTSLAWGQGNATISVFDHD